MGIVPVPHTSAGTPFTLPGGTQVHSGLEPSILNQPGVSGLLGRVLERGEDGLKSFHMNW